MSTDTRSPLTKRSVLVVVVLIAAVVLVGIAAVTLSGGRSPGPLQPTSATTVEFPLSAEQTATWGSPIPPNSTSSDMIIRSIEPLGVTGLDVTGILTSRPDSGGGIVNALGYPPDGVVTAPVEGTVLPPSASGPNEVDVLIGVRLANGMQEGSIEGLRVRYVVADGTEHDVDLPCGLRITAPS